MNGVGSPWHTTILAVRSANGEEVNFINFITETGNKSMSLTSSHTNC